MTNPSRSVRIVQSGTSVVARRASRDVVDEEVIEVSPSGDVKQLDGVVAESLVKAVQQHAGSSSYRSFEYLEGFDVLVAAEFEAGLLVDLPDDTELNVAPIRALRERLDTLLARDDIEEASQILHRNLRALCDVAEQLHLPLMLAA